MFSPNVQDDVRQPVALRKFESIHDICVELNKESYKQEFFQQKIGDVREDANKFVESFAHTNGMETRTVQPLMWSFSVSGKKLFDDGVIELVHDNNDNLIFGYTDVNDSKISESGNYSNSVRQIKPKSDLVEIDNLHAHEAWLIKLGEQVTGWKNDLERLGDHEKEELSLKLSALEGLLQTTKTESKKITRDTILEIEHQWNIFQSTLEKFKNKMKKS